ncbi:hypothetical protein [Pseudomonas cremoricolorata]|uniref:Uncharacterized protein n=1 Tax=Pseudomonas cremoricolorata TaxID=157783 RepID=A0A089YCR6_9PSED|nr:hypothetical protein [Pseudomonas cremoricolorata]AIR89573.1 hypothetical protein LK03_09875 [Pseudomonas cremoricolorata]
MNKTSDTAQATQGLMTASIDGQAFKAVQVEWDTVGGVIGLIDDDHFIYLGFPKDIEKGEHSIGKDGVRAYVGGTHSGEATSGTLMLQSAGTPGRKMEGKFDFVAKSDPENVTVTAGRFTVSVGARTAGQGSGSASAKLDEPLEGNLAIEAKTMEYNGEPTAPTALFAMQTKDLQGGLQRFGVIFMLRYDGQGKPSVESGFVAVDFAALITSKPEVTSLKWEPGKSLSFKFTMSFSYNKKDYKIEDGSLDLTF